MVAVAGVVAIVVLSDRQAGMERRRRPRRRWRTHRLDRLPRALEALGVDDDVDAVHRRHRVVDHAVQPRRSGWRSGTTWVRQTASNWLPLAGLALVGGVIGHTLMNWSLCRIPLWIGSALTLLIPVSSSLLAWVFLDESLSPGQLVAMAVVIGVLVVLVRGQAPSEARVDDTKAGASVAAVPPDVIHGT